MGVVERAGNLKDSRVIEPHMQSLVAVIWESLQFCRQVQAVELPFFDECLESFFVGERFGILEDPLDLEPLIIRQVLPPVKYDLDLVFRRLAPRQVHQGP